jgi:hypothetical protein
VDLSMDAIRLEQLKEALDDGVIVAAATPAHAAQVYR